MHWNHGTKPCKIDWISLSDRSLIDNLQYAQLFLTLPFAFCAYIVMASQPVRNFGIMQEYNERRNKKLINNFQLNDRPMYWVTSSRPSNFGDPLDAKTKADNWFDENR